MVYNKERVMMASVRYLLLYRKRQWIDFLFVYACEGPLPFWIENYSLGTLCAAPGWHHQMYTLSIAIAILHTHVCVCVYWRLPTPAGSSIRQTLARPRWWRLKISLCSYCENCHVAIENLVKLLQLSDDLISAT